MSNLLSSWPFLNPCSLKAVLTLLVYVPTRKVVSKVWFPFSRYARNLFRLPVSPSPVFPERTHQGEWWFWCLSFKVLLHCVHLSEDFVLFIVEFLTRVFSFFTVCWDPCWSLRSLWLPKEKQQSIKLRGYLQAAELWLVVQTISLWDLVRSEGIMCFH